MIIKKYVNDKSNYTVILSERDEGGYLVTTVDEGREIYNGWWSSLSRAEEDCKNVCNSICRYYTGIFEEVK